MSKRLCALFDRVVVVSLSFTLAALLSGCGDGAQDENSLDVKVADPPLGPREGGIKVALRGSGFVAPAEVFFGGAPASEVEVVSKTELRLTLPALSGVPGPVDVTVNTPERRIAREGLFTYYALSLVTQPVPSTPAEPRALAALDLNRDGIADLVLARQNPPGLSILLSNGEAPPTVVEQTLGNEPSALSVADINGDGLQDLLVADTAHAEVWLLLGLSDGRLSAGAPVPLGCTPNALHSADLTGDGRPDVIVGCVEANQSAYLLKNQYGPGGISALASPQPLSGVPGPVSLAVADWNGDSRLDVALVSARASSLQIFSSQGGGSFVAGAAQTIGRSPQAVLSIDVNQDGKLDLLTADSVDAQVGVLLGDGAGHFTAATPLALGYAPGALCALDWNGDGKQDLAIGNRDANQIRLHLSVGDGSFQSGSTIGTSGSIAALLAFAPDGGGAPALATAMREQSRVSVFRRDQNSPSNSLTERVYATRPTPRSPLAADLTNDGRLDVSWVEGERITLLPSVGDGSFEAPVSFYTLSAPTSLVSGDWNSDQLADLATTTSSGISLFLSRGPGALQASVDLPTLSAPTRILSADLDQDGRLDLITATKSSALRIQLGNGNGTFRPGFDVDMGGIPVAVTVSDLNGDDRRDLLVMTETEVRVRLGLLNGGFGELKVQAAGSKLLALASADMNLDGVRDLVLTDAGSGVVLLFGLGDGGFRAVQTVASSGMARYLGILDLDRDGNLDVALTDEGRSTIAVLLGKTDGTLLPPLMLDAGMPASGLAFLDLDGDRYSELLVTSALGYSILRNTTQR